jgi:hypothetical protein
MAYPEVAPLADVGRGSIERYELTIANLSGLDLKLEAPKGLQPIDLAQIHSEDSLGLSGEFRQSFRATGGRWSLGFRIGRAGQTSLLAAESRPTRVTLSTISAVIGDGGEVWGHARCDLDDQPGPFLSFRLPEPAEVPWSMVDGLIQPVLRDGPGLWLVPLGDRQARRVSFLWHRPRTSVKPSSGDSAEIPSISSSLGPTLVRISAPSSLTIESVGNASEKVDPSSMDVELAERQEASISHALMNLDRSAPRERERLIEALVDLELQARTLARRSTTSGTAPGLDFDRIKTVLANLENLCTNEGLEDVFREAQARAGLSRSAEEPMVDATASPAEMLRVRRIGSAVDFRVRSENQAHSPTFHLAPSTRTRPSETLERWGIVAVGVLLGLFVGSLIGRARGVIRRRFWILSFLVLAAAIVWEPAGMASLVACLGLGWKSR